MGVLIYRLLIVLNDREPDSTYYHIASTMLANYDGIGRLSIQELADLCGVSKSTISKFIRDLGFEDYIEFRYELPFASNKYGNSLNYNSNIMRFLDDHDPADYVAAAQADLAEVLRSVDPKVIDQLAHDLVDYERVAAFGLMFSETAALDLQTKLAYSKKFISTSLSDTKQNRFIASAGPDTLIIVFSTSGDYIRSYQLTPGHAARRDFLESKAKVVLITSNEAMKDDPRLAYCICFKNTTRLQNHRFVYGLICDLVVHRYRELTGQA